MSDVEKADCEKSAATTTIPHPPQDHSENQSVKNAESSGNQSTQEASGANNCEEEKGGGGTDVPQPSDLELLAKLEEANRLVHHKCTAIFFCLFADIGSYSQLKIVFFSPNSQEKNPN